LYTVAFQLNSKQLTLVNTINKCVSNAFLRRSFLKFSLFSLSSSNQSQSTHIRMHYTHSHTHSHVYARTHSCIQKNLLLAKKMHY